MDIILKPSSDEDWYTVWSTVCDGPIYYGTRASLLSRPGGTGATPERMDRADATGTSSLISDPIWGRTADSGMIVRLEEGPIYAEGTLPYPKIREFTEALAVRDYAVCRALIVEDDDDE